MATVVPNPQSTPSVARTARTGLSIQAPNGPAGPAPQDGVVRRSHAEATAKAARSVEQVRCHWLTSESELPGDPIRPTTKNGVDARNHSVVLGCSDTDERSRFQAASMRACSGTGVPRRRAAALTYQISGPARTAEQLGRLVDTTSAGCHCSQAAECSRVTNTSAFAVVPGEGVNARW